MKTNDPGNWDSSKECWVNIISKERKDYRKNNVLDDLPSDDNNYEGKAMLFKGRLNISPPQMVNFMT